MSLVVRFVWIGSLIVAFLLGGLVASWWSTSFFMKHAAFTTAMESSYRVERLAMMRLGRPDDAIAREELFLDNAVHSASFTAPDPTRLSGDALRAWQVVKLYRERVPSSQATIGPAVDAWLAKVPPMSEPDRNKACSGAISEFLGRVSASGASAS